MPFTTLLNSAVELERLRLLIHQEPHVRRLGYGQYGDEREEEPEAMGRLVTDSWQ